PRNACIDRSDTRDFRHLLDQAFWRARDHGKNISESIALVVGGAGLVERAVRARCHKKGCDPAANYKCNRQHLCPEPPDISKQLAVKHVHGSPTECRCGLSGLVGLYPGYLPICEE